MKIIGGTDKDKEDEARKRADELAKAIIKPVASGHWYSCKSPRPWVFLQRRKLAARDGHCGASCITPEPPVVPL